MKGRSAGSGAAAAVAAGAAVAIAFAVQVPILMAGVRDGALLPLAASGAAFAAAPLALRGQALPALAIGLRGAGRFLFYVAAYALSFVSLSGAMLLRGGGGPAIAAALPAFLLAAAALAVGLRRGDVEAHARGEAMLLAATVLAFAAGLSLPSGEGAALVANMALAFLAVGRIVRGMSALARGPFVEGVALATVLVTSRTLEVLASPLARLLAVALLAAGAIAIVLVFERRRARAPKPARAEAS